MDMLQERKEIARAVLANESEVKVREEEFTEMLLCKAY